MSVVVCFTCFVLMTLCSSGVGPITSVVKLHAHLCVMDPVPNMRSVRMCEVCCMYVPFCLELWPSHLFLSNKFYLSTVQDWVFIYYGTSVHDQLQTSVLVLVSHFQQCSSLHCL